MSIHASAKRRNDTTKNQKAFVYKASLDFAFSFCSRESNTFGTSKIDEVQRG
jgi:hypothetical protein